MNIAALSHLIENADADETGAGYSIDLWLTTGEKVEVLTYGNKPFVHGCLVVWRGERNEALIDLDHIVAARINWAPGLCLFEEVIE